MIEQFFSDNWFNLGSFLTSTIAASVAWWQSRRVRKIEEERAAYDLHKDMYTNMADDVQKLQDKVLQLFEERAKDAEEKILMREEIAHLRSHNALLREAVLSYRQCPNVANCRVMQAAQKIAPSILQKPKGRHRPRDIDMDATEESSLSDHPP